MLGFGFYQVIFYRADSEQTLLFIYSMAFAAVS